MLGGAFIGFQRLAMESRFAESLDGAVPLVAPVLLPPYFMPPPVPPDVFDQRRAAPALVRVPSVVVVPKVPGMAPAARPPQPSSPQRIAPTPFVRVLLVVARGPSTAAVLRYRAEVGSQVTYSWETEIQRMRKGLEYRISRAATPRESYQFAALLSNAEYATLQTALVHNEALASAFAVALEHEALVVTGGSGKTVSVPTTAYSDWMYAGQTCIVIGLDGLTYATGVLQGFTSTSITLDTDVSAVAATGARIMPTIPSYIDGPQGFGLYTVNLATLQLRSRAGYFGNATGDWAPRGASATIYTDATAVAYPVWDRGLETKGTTPRAVIGDAEIADRGGALVTVASTQTVTDFSREILFTIRADADRQLLKAFLGAVQGRQKVFLLPTWRPDFTATSDASTSVLTATSYNDLSLWWSDSSAHQHLQLLMADGTVNYVQIEDVSGGVFPSSFTIQLDRGVTGAIAMVSFLEQCRLDTDDIVVRYIDGVVGQVRIPCRVVQQ